MDVYGRHAPGRARLCCFVLVHHLAAGAVSTSGLDLSKSGTGRLAREITIAMPYEQINQSGFLFTQTSVRLDLLKAPAGDGFALPSAVISDPAGLRSWSVKIDALPDSDAQAPKIGSETRAEYLWNFFLASKASGNAPFWIEDPKDEKFYLAEFVDDELTYEILCSKVYSAGLSLRQRRAADQETPVEEIP